MQRSRSTSLAVAAAAALGALITMTAPIAHAEKIPEKTIKSECV